jgi:hypothetical protein
MNTQYVVHNLSLQPNAKRQRRLSSALCMQGKEEVLVCEFGLTGLLNVHKM